MKTASLSLQMWGYCHGEDHCPKLANCMPTQAPTMPSVVSSAEMATMETNMHIDEAGFGQISSNDIAEAEVLN